MNDPISSINCKEPRQLETFGFSRVIPPHLVEMIQSMREKTLSYSFRPSTKRLRHPVAKHHNDCDESSKCTQNVSQSILAPQMSLEHLKSQGFVELAEKLKSKNGFPWDEILKFNHPLLIEQLYDLATLIELKCGCQRTSYMSYGLKIASEANLFPSPILGMYIHLLDKDPDTVYQSANSHDDFLWIETQFLNVIENRKAALAKYKRKHRKAKLQNHEIAYRNRLPIELSYFLLSSTGHFNIGLADPLIAAFIKSPLNYESCILRILKQLKHSPSLREKLSQIKKPKSSETPANIVIRTTLGLSPADELQDLDAARTALASLLTMLRQGKDGSCFATPLAISLLNSHLELCLKDFQQLIAESKLTRNVEGVYVDFPFILRIGDQNLSEKVRISRTGRLLLPNGRLILLSKIPGVIAVKTAIGIEKIKITKSLFTKEQPYVDITLKELLQALVKQAKALPINKKTALSELYLHAVFAYEAQECNPLLQVWENAIACMAEADDKSMVRSAILKSSQRVLAKYLKQSLTTRKEMRHQAAALFNRHLNEKIHLQWDPHITSDCVAGEQSTEGAFVLYDKDGRRKPSRWLRLDHPKAYQSFILRTVDEVGKEMRMNLDGSQWTKIQQTLNELESYVESEPFLVDSLIDYYPPNGDIPEVLNQLKHLSYTPWITKSGNNLHKVLQIYFEQPDLKACARLTPKNGEELLQSLILMLRNSTSPSIKNIETHPDLCTPIRIPYVHAFTFLPGHPTLLPAWTKSSEPAEWIKQNVLQKGVEISESPLSKDAREAVIQRLAANLVSKTDKTAFIEQMDQLPKSQSIKEFRQSILELMIKLNSSIKLPLQILETQIDQQIYTSLPNPLKEKLHASAIHIADTNWADGINAIHFSLVVNPGTGQIVLWGIKDDSSQLIPLDQSIWFENNSWEFFID